MLFFFIEEVKQRQIVPVSQGAQTLDNRAVELWFIGDLPKVKGKLDQTGYHSILQHHTIPSGTRFVGQGFVLIQDNNRKHTSKICHGKDPR